MLAFISLPGAETIIGLGEDVLDGGGDDEEVARQTQSALQCESDDVDVDLAQKAAVLAQEDSELRSLLSDYASRVDWAGGTPDTVEEQACGWSNHVHIGWPSPGSRTYELRQEILRKVEDGADVEATPGAAAPEDDGGGFLDDLGDLADQILRPGEIEERARDAFTGAQAGAQAGARGRSAFDAALPWIMLAGAVLVGVLILRRT
ncbi:MAG: hypothetical protein ACOC83_06520 [Gemmatimonadota bacterium]